MKRISLTLVAFALLVSSVHVLAQSWRVYANQEDRFSVNFPGDPEIEDVDYLSEHGHRFPARQYSVRNDSGVYLVTVVDFRDAQRIHLERLANESEAEQQRARNRWIADQRAATARAAREFRQRGGEVTYDAWAHIENVEGHQLQISNNDGTRTFVGLYFHAHARKFYILEATVPRTSPPPGQFQQSLTFSDDFGNRIRYCPHPEGYRICPPVGPR